MTGPGLFDGQSLARDVTLVLEVGLELVPNSSGYRERISSGRLVYGHSDRLSQRVSSSPSTRKRGASARRESRAASFS